MMSTGGEGDNKHKLSSSFTNTSDHMLVTQTRQSQKQLGHSKVAERICIRKCTHAYSFTCTNTHE